jgi:hypothetical protein
MLFCGACTRNPLGEDIRQPILNLSFTLTQNCTNTFNQDVPYSCQLQTSDVVAAVQFQLDTLLTTCSWASLDTTTGLVTGGPGDNQVGACQIVVSAFNEFRTSPAYVYYVNVVNVQPTLTIANPSPVFEDTAPTVIRTDADVQASEEGLGLYSLDNANTTLPRCSDNAAVLSIDANTGAVTFGPVLNYTGTCNIRVVFDDQNGVSSSTVVSEFPMTVLDINDPPVLSAIANQTTNEDTPIAVNFTITDPENGVTCATSVSAVSSNAALVPVANIVFSGTAPNCVATISPTLNNTGSSNITFTLTDTGVPVLTDTQGFTLSVVAVNDAPDIAAIGAQTTNEDTPLVVNFTISDVDSTLNCNTSLSAASSDGAIVPVGNIVFGGVAPNCTATITPLPDQFGILNLTFTVADSGMPVQTDASAFALTVSPVNDAPVISAIGSQATNEDTPLAVNFTISDVDSTVDCTTSLSATSTNAGLVPVANIVFSGTAPNCTATVSPSLNATGTSTLNLTVTDSGMPVLTDSSAFVMTVNAVNDAPVMSAIAAQATNEDTPLTVNFTVTDVDSTLDCTADVTAGTTDAALVSVPSVVFSGTAPNCTATITPLPDQNGLVDLTFTVTDAGMPVLTDAQTFTLTVNPVNDDPVMAVIGPQSTNEDTLTSVNFTITDIDSPLTCATSVTALSNNAGLVPAASIVFSGVAPNCTATFTPVADQNGTVDLTFTVSDGYIPTAGTHFRTFTLTVNAVNDAPVISAIAAQSTNEDVPASVNFTITDVDSTLDCTTDVAATTTNAGLVPAANVSFSGTAPNCTATISPVLDQYGNVDLTFTVSDSGMPVENDATTFTLTVNPINDSPVVAPIAAQTVSEDSFVNVNFTISDVDSILDCTSSVTASTTDGSLVPVGAVSFSGTAPNCTATITPLADQNGSVDLTFTATDNGVPIGTGAQTFTLTVNPVNDAPVMAAIGPQTVEESDSVVVNFTVSDIDSILTCSALNLSATSSNAGLMPVASIVFGGTIPNCTATFTPTPGLFGASNISFTVNDNGAPNLQDSQNFVLTVTPFNDPPVMSAIGPQSTNEDTQIAINFTISDVDNVVDCATSMSATSNNAGLVPAASVVFTGAAPNCTATFTPAADQNGTVDLTFIVTDTGSPVKNDSETFTLTVNAVNDAPVLGAIGNQSTNEDTAEVINFTINDVDNTLNCATSITVGTTNAGLVPAGNVVFTGTAPNCTATITPVLDQNGSVNLTFTLADTGTPVQTDAETFTLTVTAVNDAPVLSLIGNQTTNEDTAEIINYTITDVDSTLDCTTSMAASTTNVSLVPAANVTFTGTAPNCTATINPVLDQNGSVDLTFTVSDGGAPVQSDAETFTLTVTAVNDAPVLSAIGNQTTNEDNAEIINFTITDVDDTLDCTTSIAASTNNASLVPTANVVFTGTAPNCTATVNPVFNQNGTVDLTFTVSDTGAPVQTDAETFTLTVNAVNDPPVLSAIGNQTTLEDNAEVINFTITDVDSTLDCTTAIAAATTNAGLVPVANVAFTGTAPNCTATINPVLNQNGTVDLTFTVSDGGVPVQSDAETFTLTVTAVNDAPVLSAIGNQTTNEDNAEIINFTITDVDSTLDCTTSVAAGTTNAALVPVGNVVFTGTAPNCTATVNPVLNQNGTVDLTFTVSDGGAPVETDAETFTLTVNAVNDAPVLSAIGNQSTNEDAAEVINFTVTDVDDTLSCTTSIAAGSNNAGLAPVANVVFTGTAPNCTATITPVLNQHGTVDLTFTVSDTGAPVQTDAETFTLTVNSVNDAPVISAIGNQSIPEDSVNTVNFTITDVDDIVSCTTSLSGTSSNGVLLPAGNIIFSGTAPNCSADLTPVADGFGASNVRITVTDTGTPAQSAFQDFTLTVVPVNDPPVLSAIGNQTTNEDTDNVINFTITDVDHTLTCAGAMSATSSNAAVVPVANIVFTGVAPNCTATISPVLNASGSSNIIFTVTDGAAAIDTESFSLTVNAVNDPPVLSAIGNQATAEDTIETINFTITDVDSTLDCTTSIGAATSNAALIPLAGIAFTGTAPNCSATITPTADQFGAANLTFTVSDGGAPVQTDFETFTLTVTAVNDAPVISSIANETVNEDNSAVVNFTITDVDSPMACTATYLSANTSDSSIINAANIIYSGTAPNCAATIPPELNQTGAVNVTIRVTDSNGDFMDSTFSVTLTPVNDPPTITDVTNQTINEDSNVGPLAFTIGDVDSVLLCTSSNVTATSSNTALIADSSLVIGGAFPNCTVSAMPELNMSGSTTITLTVIDNGTPNLQSQDTFTVTVNAVNDAPTISALADQTINEEASTGPLTFTIGDVETSGSLTCAGSVTASSNNTTVIPNANIVIAGTAPNCDVTVTPPANQFGGPVTITLTVTDTGLPLPAQSTPTTFNVTVNNVNDAPVISTVLDQVTDENLAIAVNFTINDIDSTLTCAGSMSAASTNTTVQPVAGIVFSGTAPNCTATITPGLYQWGTSNLTLTVTDSGGLTHATTFLLTVNDVDQTPTISAIADTTRNEDNNAGSTGTSTAFNTNFTISDVDSTLTCAGSLSGTSSNTALVPDANITFSGTAPNCVVSILSNNNATGTTTITLTVTDGNSSSMEPFVVTYTPINDNPTITTIADTSTYFNVPIIVSFTIADVDSVLNCNLGPPPAGSLLRQSLNPAMVANTGIVFGGTAPNCTATITPVLTNANQSGTIIIRVRDATSPNVNSTFNLSVLANAAPVISPIADASFSVGAPTPINFTISDANDSLSCTSHMSAVSSNPAVVPNGNIVFSGTAPNCTATVTATSTGSTSITYTVTDPWGGTASTGNNVNGLTAGSVAISPSLSTLTVTANASVNSSQAFTQVNETVTLTVRARDVNNVSAGGGHWVVIQKDAGTSNGVLSAVTDNNDGTYTATFTGTTIGAARTFRASINGYPLTSALPSVTVSSAGPNCLSYRNVGSNVSGIYYLDSDGDVGASGQFPAYCDMVTQGGGWTLAAIPRKGIAPFNETSGLVSPSVVGPARNANVWSAASQFAFTQLRVTDGVSAYSTANFNQTKSISSLLASYPVYSQNNVAAGGSAANASVTSSIGSTCFIIRGKSASAGLWDDSADFLFMGFHGGISCVTPLNYGNDWDRMNVTQQWLISGYDGLNSGEGPEESNSNVGQNFTGSDWTNLDYPTLIWLK